MNKQTNKQTNKSQPLNSQWQRVAFALGIMLASIQRSQGSKLPLLHFSVGISDCNLWWLILVCSHRISLLLPQEKLAVAPFSSYHATMSVVSVPSKVWIQNISSTGMKSFCWFTARHTKLAQIESSKNKAFEILSHLCSWLFSSSYQFYMQIK